MDVFDELSGFDPWNDDEEPVDESAKKKILAVDDNGPTLRVIKAMLSSEYEVMIVNSGMNAMKAMGKDKPDLILLDYDMPVCDGRQVLEMIRADDELKDIPVVFLTGVNDREHIEPILAMRPAGYILKPLDKKRLLDTIAAALGRAAEAAERKGPFFRNRD